MLLEAVWHLDANLSSIFVLLPKKPIFFLFSGVMKFIFRYMGNKYCLLEVIQISIFA